MLVGILAASLAPGSAVLGEQLAVAPVPRVPAALGLTIAPVAALVAAAAVPVVLVVAPLSRAATPAAMAAFASGVALGAVAYESALALGRRALRGVAFALLGALVAAADPLAPAATALQGDTSLRVFPVAALAFFVWGACALLRPERRPARGVVRVLTGGVVTSALARYARRSELRRHAVTAVALAAAASATLRAAGFAPAPAVLLASISAIVGAAMIPLAAAGLDARADWLWRAAPTRLSWLYARFAVASLFAGGVVASVAVASAWIFAPADPRQLGPLAAATAVVFGGALLAGAVGPRSERTGLPLASLAAFAAVAVFWAVALGRLASAIGAETGIGAGILAVGSLAVAVLGATAARSRRTA